MNKVAWFGELGFDGREVAGMSSWMFLLLVLLWLQGGEVAIGMYGPENYAIETMCTIVSKIFSVTTN